MKAEHKRLVAEAGIAPDKPFLLRAEVKGQKTSLTMIGYDHPQLFNVFCGVLAASSLEIETGELVTTPPIKGRRLIIDQFTGRLVEGIEPAYWESGVNERLAEFYALFEGGASREAIQQRVVELVIPSLRTVSESSESSMLDPIHLSIKQMPGTTRIRIESSDTPFFLFSLGTVLNLLRLKVERVFIETRQGRLIDSIEVVDEGGMPIHDRAALDRTKLSVLITKQFTFFLDRAPDPAKALIRFSALIESQVCEAEDLLEFLASSRFHGELGRLLGTSDFLWEDFIRVQQENIIPLLRTSRQLLSRDPQEVEAALAAAIAGGAGGAGDRGAQAQALNHFKNRESFLIDMDHIMMRDQDFFFLSRRLSTLADAVLRQACAIAWSGMTADYGQPRTAGGVLATWALFGLGKLGGQALGYASDLELLFVFADNGETDGAQSISNRDFFKRFFKKAAGIISAKKKGIFQIDLRLRPHGMDGPLAVKLDAFNEYFRAGGPAHSAERLALVRLRLIGGDAELGAQCLALRDHIVYESDSIIIPELRKLRTVQIQEKIREKTINIKFSPGGLVDLEYNVQILQVIHGRKHENLRGPGIHDALRALSELGTIAEEETGEMINAYRFYRNIINGLRMLRGNAEDLFLPLKQAQEFLYLARRVGYKKLVGLSESEQLIIDWETHSAGVRQFVERHLGSDAIPGQRRISIVDVLLDSPPGDGGIQHAESERDMNFLTSCGFQNPQRALVNIRRIAGYEREKFIPLLILAWDRIIRSTDLDMALNNWEQFSAALKNPAGHFKQLLSKPVRMDIIFKLFARSQFLADILIANPGFFLWATDPAVVTHPRTQIDMEEALGREAADAVDREDWRNRLRRIKKKEILRIGLRDIALGVKIEEIMGEISFLARSCVETALRRIIAEEAADAGGGAGGSDGAGDGDGDRAEDSAFLEEVLSENISVLAFGKLGGWELNYSSDIDLLCIYRPDSRLSRDLELRTYTRVFRRLVQDLSDFTQEGQAYRVDMRLRPYGASGNLVSSLPSILEYYRSAASPWEFQALIKLKPIAGNLSCGEELLENLRADFYQTWEQQDPLANIAAMRRKSISHHVADSSFTAVTDAGDTGGAGNAGDIAAKIEGFDVKNDHGGIRDIEFFLQGHQMLHSKERILTGNTLRGLSLLARKGIISAEMGEALSEYYRFFRRVEHYLQLADNKQLHRLPEDKPALLKLIQCIQPSWTAEQFFRYFRSSLREVHEVYQGLVGAR